MFINECKYQIKVWILYIEILTVMVDVAII